MNKKVRFQVFLYAVLAVLIPFLAWSQAEEYKNEKRFPAARYVAKGEAIKSGDLGIASKSEFKPEKEMTLLTADASVPAIYGSLVYSEDWASLATKDWKYGVYAIPAAGKTSELIADIDVSEAMTATLVGDRYYVVTRRFEDTGAIAQIYLNVYNINTWELIDEIELESYWHCLPLVITYDRVDDKIYALKYSEDWLTYELATLDTATGEMTIISTLGDVETMPSVYTLSGAVDGYLYAVCTDGKFYSIEKQSGVMTAIGELGCVPTGIQSSVYDYDTQTLYWAAVTTADETMLCTINLKTGAASIVNKFPVYEEYIGLYILKDDKPSNTPEQVAAEFNFSAPASMTGTLELTAPDKTIGGDEITEDLTITIYVDSEEYETLVAEPASEHSLEMTFAEGKHLIEMTATCQELTSNKAYLSVYAGYDSPKPVKNVHLEISEDGVATLTWDVEEESVNGGYVAFDELRFRVLRNDGSIAAENLTDNRFSEQLTDAINTYSYSVIAYTQNAQSVEAGSNKVKHGSYYAVPYFNNFEMAAEVDGLFKFINNNKDGDDYQWWHTYGVDAGGYVLQYVCNWDAAHGADDYAITPSIKLEEAGYYRLTFRHMLNPYYDDYVNKLELLIGTEATVDGLTTQIANFSDISDAEGSDTKEVYFNVLDDGLYYVAFHLYSGAAQGSFWIDDLGIEKVGLAEAPASVDFELTPINEKPEKVEISLKAPTTRANGKELTSLTAINIYRDAETEPCHVINNPAIGESYTWTDENPVLGLAKYRVVAVNEIGESYSELQSVFVGGYIPPYTETFDLKENFDLFKIINVNNDDKTWYFNNGTAKYEYDITNDADDWLFSPNIQMNSDRVYKISFTGRSTQWNPENLKMTVGTTQEATNQKVLVDLQDWSVQENETHYAYYVPEMTESHFVGFHAYSKKAKTFIEIDELSVENVYSAYAPSAVENLVVDADMSGLPQATLTFDAPETNAKGERIHTLTKIEIYRDDSVEPVHTIEAPQVGETLTWVDEAAKAGNNMYRIVPFNEHGEGIDKYIDGYVGYDVPDVVNDFVIKGDSRNANAIISWSAPTAGANGGHINAETLTYNVYREDENGQFVMLAKDLTETVYVDEINYEGVQKGFRYTVAAKTAEGISLGIIRSVVLGSLYDMPFEESFADQSVSTYQWTMSTPTTEACSLIMVAESAIGTGVIYSQDSDKGFLRFYKWNDETEPADAYITTPKVSLASSSSPTISFYVYHITGADGNNKVTPYISVNDDDRILLGEPISVKAEQSGWVRYTYSLEEYKESDFIKITLHAELVENSCSILLDAVMIDDALENNLAVDAFAGSAEIGVDGGEFAVDVKNRGFVTAEKYEVSLYCDGVVLETQSAENLESFAVQQFTFKVEAPSVVEAGQVRKYHAEIIFEEDEKMSDNISGIIESVVYTPPYPTITDLSGYAYDSDKARLSWSEPGLTYYYPTKESFESYALYEIYDLGSWTLVDLDGQRTYGPKYGVSFTHVFDPKAWQVIDPQRINLYANDCAPHSGSKCLMSMGSDGYDPDGNYIGPCNDDWLISEEVFGGSQISFWAKQPTSAYGNEKFEVLYSTTDKDTDSFILIEEVELQNMAIWNEYTYTLPEDAKYFAIRHTYSAFGLWLDDITYSPLSVYEILEVENYNIYRDNVKVGESTTNSYTDENLPDGLYNYAVTANFTLGESALSNNIEVLIDRSSVESVENNNMPVVYAHNGSIIVKYAQRVLVEIFSADGKLCHEEIMQDAVSIPMEPGVYVVKIGDYTEKVIVE